jgi:hypothetical protein
VDFEGEFETHITVHALDTDAIDSLRVWAESHRLTFSHIVLERGKTPFQPMVGRRGHGGLSGELAAAEELSHLLNSAGFEVSRIKVEAAPWNTDIPVSDADAVNHPGRYFEHHVKLALDQVDNLAALTALAVANSAHLSRNARRVREDGKQERFVTQRCHAVGRFTARARLDAFLAALLAGKYEVLSVEEEFVVYDSAPGIDAGWIDEGVGK